MKTTRISDPQLFEKYLALRKEVFVDEQQVDISLEIDYYDTLDNQLVDHFAFMVKDIVIGTCRGIWTSFNRVRLGRFSIHNSIRHQGFGLKFLRSVESYYLDNNVESIYLHAQVQALPFYLQAGYLPKGEIFDDAGIDHIECTKILKPSFYGQLAKYYDAIFPLTDLKKSLLTNWSKELSTVLDVGCGSGLQAHYLLSIGKNVLAIDINDEMIQKASDKNIDVLKMDMLEIHKLNRTFDGIYCLGNTLVHLDGTIYIEGFLKGCFEKLNHDGSLLIQIINYDKVINKQLNSLPTIRVNKPKIEFIRNYSFVKGKIDFHGILYHQKKRYENHQLLFPLKHATLIRLLKKTGFDIVNTYGSFRLDPYSKDESESLIIIARKRHDPYE